MVTAATQAQSLRSNSSSQLPAPEPLNAANLASASSYNPASQSQLYQQWGFVNHPVFTDAFTSTQQQQQQQPQQVPANDYSGIAQGPPPFRAYTPSYSSQSSIEDASAFPQSLPPSASYSQPGYSMQDYQQQHSLHQQQHPQAWRDRAHDDGLSLYSASSVSRPGTPASNLSPFHGATDQRLQQPGAFSAGGSASPSPLLHAAGLDPGHLVLGDPAVSPAPSPSPHQQQLQHQQPRLFDHDRDATMHPPTQQQQQPPQQAPSSSSSSAALQQQPHQPSPSRESTVGGLQPNADQHAAQPPSDLGSLNFLGQCFSASPTGSPRADLPPHSTAPNSYFAPDYGTSAGAQSTLPAVQVDEGAATSQSSKNNSLLSKLNIPLMAPSIELECATATAGPVTAKPSGQTSTQLDRMIAQSQGVSVLHFFCSPRGPPTVLMFMLLSPFEQQSSSDHLLPAYSHQQQQQPQGAGMSQGGAGPSASQMAAPQQMLAPHQHPAASSGPRKSRSHSETDLAFMMFPPPQDQHQQHPQQPQGWASQSINPHALNPPSFFPQSASRQSSADDMFNNPMRDSLVGPRRSSNVSERPSFNWPYDQQHAHAPLPGRPTSAEPMSGHYHQQHLQQPQPQAQPAPFVRGHHRMAMSEDLSHMPSSSANFFGASSSSPAFGAQQQQQQTHEAARGTPSPLPPSPQPYPGGGAPQQQMQPQHSQQAFSPMPVASLFDGSGFDPSGQNPLAPQQHHMFPTAGVSNECPSPAMSMSSGSTDPQQQQPYFDASQHMFSSSNESLLLPPEAQQDQYASTDSAGNINVASQTTMATKEAAARRRKPGTEAKYSCHYCGETFTRNYNLRGHMR